MLADNKHYTAKVLLIFVVGLFFECTCYRVSEEEDNDDIYSVTIRMPQAVSKKPDDLLCHAVQVQSHEAYILRFEPHASKNTAHHMMVYGCGKPGSNQSYWSCGEMDDHSDRSVCGDGERQIVWAWAMDANGRSFPENTGFRVGGRSNIHYIVIQLHYAEKFVEGLTDDSGVTLYMTNEKQRYQAGYYVMYTYGYIPPMTDGLVTSGYRVRDGEWTEIGRMSPQLPQTFYDATTEGLEVKKGDILASRCTMKSERSFPTDIGPQHRDEMCNFYIMYYTDYENTLHIQYCMRDAQTFHWADYLTHPPASASSTKGIPSFTRDDPYAEKNQGGKKNRESLM